MLNNKCLIATLVLLMSVSLISSVSAASESSQLKLNRAVKRPSKAKVEVKEATSLAGQAEQELKLAPEEQSVGLLPTPATVRSRIEAVKPPMKALAFRLGVSLQPYQPEGSMRLGDLQPYDLSALGTRPMLSLEAQWLPLNLDSLQPGLQAGVFSSVGYAQHQVNLRSPTGSTLDNTQLHTLKAQLGGEARLRLPGASPWSLQAKAGLGRLNEIQSSSSSIANQSTALTFVSLGLGGEYALLERVSGFAGYEFRAPVQSDDSGASLPRHNLMVGFLGNFE